MTFVGLWEDLVTLCAWVWSLLAGIGGTHLPWMNQPGFISPAQIVSRVFANPRPAHRYTYLFEGTLDYDAIHHPKAQVVVRLTSPHGSIQRLARVDHEGHYSLELAIDAAYHEPVDWSMQAAVAGAPSQALYGRRIVMDDDEIIVVRDGHDSSSVATRHPPTPYRPATAIAEGSIG
jgi:hypothetical protein